MNDIRSDAVKGSSTVGMTILPSGDILTLNWRTKELYKCSPSGELLQVSSSLMFDIKIAALLTFWMWQRTV